MFDFLTNKFSHLFTKLTGSGHLTEKNIEETISAIKDSLLEADVPYELVNQFVKEVQEEVVGQKVLSSLKPGEQFIKIIHERITELLKGSASNNEYTFTIPSITMVMGLQGSGKTTSIAKLANYIKKQAAVKNKKRRILLASVDYYRPAAIDQLEVLAKQVGVDFFRAEGTDPIAATQQILNHFRQNQYELLYLDTAGRLQIDNTMLEELRELEAIVQPKSKLLVLDSMTGQESLNVAKAFDDAVGFHGAIMTKADSDTRGGAAFSFGYTLKKPIYFVGVGEKIDDLEGFNPQRMATRILGMGDIETLIEKAQREIKESEQKSMEHRMRKGSFTLEDFAKQMSMVDRLGSLGSIAKYIPGMGQLTPEMIQQGESDVKRFKAIISSMTQKERSNHRVLDGSRKKRIASGAGVSVTDVNGLLERFEQSQQFVKLFSKGKLRNFFK